MAAGRLLANDAPVLPCFPFSSHFSCLLAVQPVNKLFLLVVHHRPHAMIRNVLASSIRPALHAVSLSRRPHRVLLAHVFRTDRLSYRGLPPHSLQASQRPLRRR